MGKPLPRNFESCAVGRRSAGNIPLRVDGHHADCVMIVAIEIGFLHVIVNVVRLSRAVWPTKAAGIGLDIL